MLHFGEGARPRGLVVTPLRPPEDVWSSWVKRGGAYSAQEFQRVWGINAARAWAADAPER
jgi:hypothetical protein